jgi:hypothetical protein
MIPFIVFTVIFAAVASQSKTGGLFWLAYAIGAFAGAAFI